MAKYQDYEVIRFFEKSNLSCGKLGSILDIPVHHVESYLLGDGKCATTIEKIKIDAAISIVKEMKLKQPIWYVHQGKTVYEETVGQFNTMLRNMVLKETERAVTNCCSLIFAIISDPDSDAFRESEDPLKDCGLEKYGLDQFVKRVRKRVSEYS